LALYKSGPKRNRDENSPINKMLYLKFYDDFWGPRTENFKNSKIPLKNKNLYLKSHDDFRGQGTENLKKLKIPLTNKNL
jgi:hypothetical protein